MRKGVLLTPRDFQILLYLSYGPAMVSSIYGNFFSKEDAPKGTRQRVMNRRLQKLEAGGLIIRAVSAVFRNVLFVLAPNAAPLVSSRYGIELTNISVNYTQKKLEHDLLIATVARILIRGQEKEKLYKLSCLLLECCLKREKKPERGDYFPDLLFEIEGPGGKTVVFSFEGDCGTVSRKDFLGKVNFFSGTILILTKTSERLDLLMWYLEYEKIRKPVYLGLFRDLFNKSNILDCKWRTPFSDAPVTMREIFFRG